MKKVLVIGATGFIGKHLVKKLGSRGYKVGCLVRRKSKERDIRFLKNLGAEIFFGDLEKPETLKGICKGDEIVFYLAGGGKVASLSKKDYENLYNYNIKTLKNFLETVNFKKIIFFSSVSAIGAQVNKVIDEKTKEKPIIPHEKIKFEAEKIIKKYSKKKKFSYAILRPSIVYGEYCFGDSYDFIKMVSRGLIFIPGNGKNITPWVYVGNVVNSAIILAEKAKDEAFIINNEERVSFNQIIKIISKYLKKKIFTFHVPLVFVKPSVFLLEKIFLFFGKSPFLNMYRLRSMTSNRLYSIEKIKNLGYNQEYGFEEGIKRTINWYKENGYI